uniref:Transposase MuDR plant domain-containing protein n=1 Tax=Lactuca sativa TaxID=4236 RepID=A0A9R1VK66_LACSA|nr:hypothetical protein LSAT_V11C500268550 [Lactuca sativa]
MTLVKVYIEIGQTRVASYFKSPSKVVIEELELESVSPELNRKKPCRREVGSCCKKPDLDHPANHVVDQSQVIDMAENQDRSKTIVSYVMSQISQQSNVIDVIEGLIMGHIEEVCKGYLGKLVEEPICEDIDGQQSVRLDEFEAFTDDYPTYDNFDVEYSVPNGEYIEVDMENLEGMISDDSGDAFYSQNGDGSDYSGDDSDDSDYIVHVSNLQFYMDVDMSDFQSVVDVDEHGILNKEIESIWNDIVDGELEVIQSDDYQYAGFYEDERTKMLKELNRIMVICGGVVVQSTEIVQCGGPSTRSKVKCKGQSTETVECGGPSNRSKSNPKIPIEALHEELCKKLELGMSVQKVVTAKQMAERVISGDYQLQYGYLRKYALQLLNTNPGSTIRIYVYPKPCLSTTTRAFRRIYVCLGALKLGFKAGLRDFLGVDGTFLKGPYLGQTKENLKKQWKGKELSDLVWECCRATTLNHFKYEMDELKKMNDEAHSWLCKIPAETWSKSHFSGMSFRSC